MTRGKRIYRTLVADSHNLFRRGLVTLVASETDMEVAGEATSASQALEFVKLALQPLPAAEEATPSAFNGTLTPRALVPAVPIPALPDVLVMDIGLVRDDPEAAKMLRQLPETVAILLLASEESPECLELTLSAGARGYMLKSSPPAKLIMGIRQATVLEDRDAQGLSRQAPDLRALAETERSYSRTSPLTAREQEVVTLLAEGRTVREVAAELSLSIKTIEAHKLNLMRKLDIHNRASLVDYAVRSGLISVQPVSKH
jgi:two-component system response regulator NreC